MRNAGVTLTRSRILEQVWGYQAEADAKIVDTYIHYLRDRVDRGRDVPMIKTLRGVGYRLDAH